MHGLDLDEDNVKDVGTRKQLPLLYLSALEVPIPEDYPKRDWKESKQEIIQAAGCSHAEKKARPRVS
jgi:hypothetical protein